MIRYLPNGIRLIGYFATLVGLLMQSQIAVIEGFRRDKAFNKSKEILLLVIQLSIVSFATYNLSMMSVTGTSPYLKYAIFLYGISVFILTRSIFKGNYLLKKIDDEITPFSVLESIDTLDTGLLVYDSDGQIILKSEKMNEIMTSTLGKIYKNGNLLWQDILKISKGIGKRKGNKVIVKSDNITYEFSLEPILVKSKLYNELIVDDVTKVYDQLEVIEKKNAELEKSYKEIDKMIRDINEIVDKEEKIRIKIHLHDTLGNHFTMLRSLFNNYEEGKLDLSLIRPLEILEYFKKEPDKTPEENIEEIKKFFKEIGINIEVDYGVTLPEEVKQVFSLIAIEGITNAIIHGEAKNIYIKYFEEDSHYLISIENDGMPAVQRIVESGGILGMRFRLKPYNGDLEVESTKPFKVVAKIKKDYKIAN